MSEVWYLRAGTGPTVPTFTSTLPLSLTQGSTNTETANINGADILQRTWGRQEAIRRRIAAGTWETTAVINVASGGGPASRVTCRIRVHSAAGAVLATPLNIQSANLTTSAINVVTYSQSGVALQDIPTGGYVTVELEVTQGTRAVSIRYNGGSGYDSRLITPAFVAPSGAGNLLFPALEADGIGFTPETGRPLDLGGRVRVDVGFLGTGALLEEVGPQPWLTLDDADRGTLDRNRLPGFVFVNVTRDLIDGVGTDRGRSRDLDDFTAGQAVFRLNNREGRFDPTNTASPFYDNLKPMRRVRITYQFRDVDVPNRRVFEGSVVDWEFGLDRGGDAWVDVRAVDDLALLGARFLERVPKEDEEDLGVGSGDTPAGRLSRILNDPQVDWRGTVVYEGVEFERPYDITSSIGEPLLCGTEWGINAADAARRALRSALKNLTLDREGRLAVYGEKQVVGPVALPDLLLFPFRFDRETFYTAVEGTVLGIRDVPWSYWHDVEFATTAAQLHNDVRVTLGGSDDEVRAVNGDSVEEFGRRELSWDTILAFEEDAGFLASDLLARYKQPNYRVETARVLLHDRRLSKTQRSDAVGADLGDLVWLVWDGYPSGPRMSVFPQFVEAVRTSYTRAGWEAALTLSARQQTGFFLPD